MHSPTFYSLLQINHTVNKEVLGTAQGHLIFHFHTTRADLIEHFEAGLPIRGWDMLRSIRLCMDEFSDPTNYYHNPIITDREYHQLRKQGYLQDRHIDSIKTIIAYLAPSELHLVVSGTAWRQDVDEAKWNNIGEDENCNIRMPSSRPLRPPPLPLKDSISTILVLALSKGILKQVKIELSDASEEQKLLLSPGLFTEGQPHEGFLRISSASLQGISSEITWERARPNGLFNGVCRLTRQDA